MCVCTHTHTCTQLNIYIDTETQKLLRKNLISYLISKFPQNYQHKLLFIIGGQIKQLRIKLERKATILYYVFSCTKL